MLARTLGLVVLIAIIIALPSDAQEKAEQMFDHLQPVDFDLDIDFRAMVWKKLDLLPSDCGRVVFFPPEAGEYAVCVWRSNKASEPIKYSAHYTKAAKALWWAAGAQKPEDSKDVPVSTTEVEVPESMAIAIKKAWKAMLHRVRYEPVDRLYLHPFEVEFEIADPDPCYGALPFGKLGKHTHALWDISQLLVKYCEADSEHRSSIATDIEHKCNNLARDLPRP